MKKIAAFAETASITIAIGSLVVCTPMGILLAFGVCAAVHITIALCGTAAMIIDWLR